VVPSFFSVFDLFMSCGHRDCLITGGSGNAHFPVAAEMKAGKAKAFYDIPPEEAKAD